MAKYNTVSKPIVCVVFITMILMTPLNVIVTKCYQLKWLEQEISNNRYVSIEVTQKIHFKSSFCVNSNVIYLMLFITSKFYFDNLITNYKKIKR